MSQFIVVLSICMIAGIAFLVISLMTLARLPHVPKDGDMTVTVAGVTIKTNSVYIGLAVVSSLFGLLLPGFMLYTASQPDYSTIRLPVRFANLGVQTLKVSRGTEDVQASPLILTLFKSPEPQRYIVTSLTTGALQFDAEYDPSGRTLSVHYTADHPVTRVLNINKFGYAEEVDDVQLPIAALPARTSVAKRSAIAPHVPSALAAIADPKLPGAPR